VAALASDGTLVPSPEELAHLREGVSRWDRAQEAEPDSRVANSVAVAVVRDLRDVLDGLPIGFARQ
jgi:hypothetical protein